MTGDYEMTVHDKVERVNRIVSQAYAELGWEHPVGAVRWVPLNQVRPNDYNPNAVAHTEMKLLYTSIKNDGYTMPIVTIEADPDPITHEPRFEIVDGFHRYTVMSRYDDIARTTGGYLPIVVIDKQKADRIASTVRHNRARGKHSVAGMSSLVFQMLEAGDSGPDICNKLGMEPEELARLKHVTGYSKLFSDVPYSQLKTTSSIMRIKAAYKAKHPDAVLPEW